MHTCSNLRYFSALALDILFEYQQACWRALRIPLSCANASQIPACIPQFAKKMQTRKHTSTYTHRNSCSLLKEAISRARPAEQVAAQHAHQHSMAVASSHLQPSSVTPSSSDVQMLHSHAQHFLGRKCHCEAASLKCLHLYRADTIVNLRSQQESQHKQE